MKSNRRIKKKGRVYCFVCLGNPRGGKCIICGYKVEKQRAPDGSIIKSHEENRKDWLLETWGQLRKNNQATTGNFALDSEIIREWGHWMQPEDRMRGIKLYLVANCLETTGDSELDSRIGEWEVEHQYDACGKCERCGNQKEVLDVSELMAKLGKAGLT